MPRDVWIGVVVCGFAVLYWLEADKIRVSPLDGPVGASGLPKSLAYALGVLAVLLIVRSIAVARIAAKAPAAGAKVATTQKVAKAAAPEAEAAPGMRPHLRALGMLALGIGYLLVVPHLGYALSVMALMLAVALYVGARPGPRTFAVAGIGGVFFYVLFVQVLDIPLPPGFWPDLLRSDLN